MTSRHPSPPVSVWVTGQHEGRTQLAQGPYVAETVRDGARIPPAIAAHAITAYTRPGHRVLDPACGAGTVLVEALRAGRDAIGLTRHRWWPIARANVTAAKRHDAAPDGMVLDTPTDAAVGQLTGYLGHIDLILTTWPRPHPYAAAQDRAEARAPRAATEPLRALLDPYRELLRPGGHVVLVVPRRSRGRLLAPPGDLAASGRAAGLVPVERCVALTAELRGSRLVVRSSLAQRRAAARHERATRQPVMLPAHHEVLVFQAPPPAAVAAAVRRPATGASLSDHRARAELLSGRAA
ncbi:DNA methylase [Streptomyces armeniacus]|uniref:DNA methylase n=1 Tax=Streptomyces armeniacus TaxID=83291 RepID=A0A345XXR3_9ACTN|nr:DNA methyltransferase [Streptomyces armeniacus]AXK36429.1 DNA methylase [Streptomyces armeniacus]